MEVGNPLEEHIGVVVGYPQNVVIEGDPQDIQGEEDGAEEVGPELYIGVAGGNPLMK